MNFSDVEFVGWVYPIIGIGELGMYPQIEGDLFFGISAALLDFL